MEQYRRVRWKRESVGRVCWIVVVTGLVLLVLWTVRSASGGRRNSASLKQTMQELARNPTQFVTNQITGGVGVLLTLDQEPSLPTVARVLAGSPADRAGLRAGDVVVQVNGASTTGRNLADVVETMRGFSLGSVAITVLRGQTNWTRLEFVIRRNSMNSLLQLAN
jgi:C-terminal processing protease CtpA/Prc